MNTDELDQALSATLDDGRLSRSERSALLEVLREAPLDAGRLQQLRARAFALARERVVDPKSREALDWLEDLNKLLARESRGRELVANKRRLELIERPHFEDARELIAPIALEIARLVTQEDPSLVKACAGAECTLQFLDRTKAHRRVFCSATACGNRAKVAAFRRRAQRATTE